MSGAPCLRTLVTEVMMDHSEPAHLTGNGLWQEGRRVLHKFVNSRSFDYVAGLRGSLRRVLFEVGQFFAIPVKAAIRFFVLLQNVRGYWL